MSEPIKLSASSLVWEIPLGIRRMSQSIELINQNAEQYLFKIKGTTRSRFIVQPASGLIKAFQKVKVTFVVDLPPTIDSSKSIVDKFMLFTLVAPPGAENKEGLDEYIKSHSDTRHETKITSNIHFVKPGDFGQSVTTELRHADVNPDLLEDTHGGDRIYESLVSEPKPNIPSIHQSKLDTRAFKPDEELFESKVTSNLNTGQAGQDTPKTPVATGSQGPVQTQQVPPEPLTNTQLERTGTREDPESLKRLKETIFKLKADLKFATVS
jgi:hypothetical protein